MEIYMTLKKNDRIMGVKNAVQATAFLNKGWTEFTDSNQYDTSVKNNKPKKSEKMEEPYK